MTQELVDNLVDCGGLDVGMKGTYLSSGIVEDEDWTDFDDEDDY